ncbi:hypothetical protein BDF14DRAFT_259161 [Spinellus fusiger]|nr:hypothetical protein BDF14DRAFT_259161 [Spinellus fusiger]
MVFMQSSKMTKDKRKTKDKEQNNSMGHFILYSRSVPTIKQECLVRSVSPSGCTGESQKQEERVNDPKRLARKIPPPPVRMVTRGVSGAIRHRSVEEILAGLDKDRPSPTSVSHPSIVRPRSRVTPLPTIMPLKRSEGDYHVPIYNGHKFMDKREKSEGFDLYAWQLRANAQPLYKTLQTARKILTTNDWMLARSELKAIKVIQNIENLKKKNLWSFKQLKRQKSVPRTKTHWDFLLDEMKWLRTDYKEERKWKIANAFMISRAVMEWHTAEDKSIVCIKMYIPTIIVKEETHLVNTLEDTEIQFTDSSMFDSPMETNTPDASLVAPLPHSSEQSMEALMDMPTDMNSNKHINRVKTISEQTQQGPESTFNEPQMSPKLIQSYRNAIMDLDTLTTVYTLPIEDFHSVDIEPLFNDLLLYEPSAPDVNDPYFNEIEYHSIVPFSPLSTQKMFFRKENNLNGKRTISGQFVRIKENEVEEVKVLPRNDRYDALPLLSPLFAPRKIKESPASLPSTPQPPSGSRAFSNWNEEDDLCLISLIIQYSFNWGLICDALNSIRAPANGERRTAWECHERWRQNNLTSLSGQVNIAYMPKLLRSELPVRRQALVKFDAPKKRQRQYNIFEAIKKTQKKRDEAQKMAAPTAAPRSTIETHGLNSNGQRLPTAMEMSMHKTQRDRQMAQAILEQRQLSAATYGLNTQPANVGCRVHIRSLILFRVHLE